MRTVFDCLYTRHVTQKRKQWHDGTATLWTSNRKVQLRDEAEHVVTEQFLSARHEQLVCGRVVQIDRFLVEVLSVRSEHSEPDLGQQLLPAAPTSTRRAPRPRLPPKKTRTAESLSEVLKQYAVAPLRPHELRDRSRGRVSSQPLFLPSDDDMDEQTNGYGASPVRKPALDRGTPRGAASGRPSLPLPLRALHQHPRSLGEQVEQLEQLPRAAERFRAPQPWPQLGKENPMQTPASVGSIVSTGDGADFRTRALGSPVSESSDEQEDAALARPEAATFACSAAPAGGALGTATARPGAARPTPIPRADPESDPFVEDDAAESGEDALFSSDVEVVHVAPAQRSAMFARIPEALPAVGAWTKEAYALFSWHPPRVKREERRR